MHIYQCGKCGKIVRTANTPQNTTTCEGNHFHQWIRIGDDGDFTFECQKCGLTIERCKATPTNTTTCEGKHFHVWRKL